MSSLGQIKYQLEEDDRKAVQMLLGGSQGGARAKTDCRRGIKFCSWGIEHGGTGRHEKKKP